jgi:hypothetical protein
MTSAYRYAEEGGRKPIDLVLADNIEKYGVEAVLGRKLTFREIARMNAARAVYTVKKQRANADNWAKFAKEHPQANDLLVYVEKLLQDK